MEIRVVCSSMDNICVLFQSGTSGHYAGAGNPERAGRLLAVQSALRALERPAQWVEATRTATDAEIALVHSPEFLQKTQRQVDELSGSRRRTVHWSDLERRDTVMSANSLIVARRATGAVLQALTAIQKGVPSTTFVAVRPPGHHACADETAGFCLLNNVAIAVRVAQQMGYQRILTVDFDVHHGDGTEKVFAGERGVVYFSTHRISARRSDDFYFPGTGQPSAHRNVINVPIALSAQARATLVRSYTERLGRELLRLKFVPDLVLVSAGFDAVATESDGGLGLLPQDYYEITKAIVAVARRSPVISVLEGGYALVPGGLGECCTHHVRALQDRRPPSVKSVKTRLPATSAEKAATKRKATGVQRQQKLNEKRGLTKTGKRGSGAKRV